MSFNYATFSLMGDSQNPNAFLKMVFVLRRSPVSAFHLSNYTARWVAMPQAASSLLYDAHDSHAAWLVYIKMADSFALRNPLSSFLTQRTTAPSAPIFPKSCKSAIWRGARALRTTLTSWWLAMALHLRP